MRRNGARNPATYRWVILAVLWFTLLVSYFDRVAIAAALPFLSADLALTPAEMGLVSGALLLSYTLVQVPAGYLSDRFGQRRIILIAIAWWTLFSILTGAAWNLLVLLAVRFLMGAGEGFHPPPLWRMLSNWFPHGRRSLPLALMLTALTLGPALAPSIALPLVSELGWRWVFFLTALPGVLAVVLVVRYLRDSPEHADLTIRTAPPPPSTGRRSWWVPHIYLTFAAFFFFGFVLYGLMSWLPTYLITYRGLELAHAGVLSTTPYVAGTVGLLVGAAVCQRWFNHVRRRFIAVGYLVTAVCIVGTVLAPSITLAGIALTLAGFFLYSGLGPFWSVPMDVVAPHEVGMWLGFINMGTQIAGFVGPVVIGGLLQATGSFEPVLVAMIVSMVLAALCLSLVRVTTTPAAEKAVTAP
ncbi:Sugar phosphate permease [Pseudonocardia thermophila]|jgi:Sugar phosphate permease|uniref:Sugar phosphate permease n=1 Tax=Pseudonocardia thermophila TaxID=1848 RepID=A0A1M6N5R7_PSETH|nr:MFS transporter [Pseudonocardia thermophila]SHJ90983.1 Sugar phosphate permease [Pseudonocardia thermophila]